MSRRFGLDWKKYDNKRVEYLIAVLSAKVERNEIDRKKARLKELNRKYQRNGR